MPARPETIGAASQSNTPSSVIAVDNAAASPVLNAAVLTLASAARSDSRHTCVLSAGAGWQSALIATLPSSSVVAHIIESIFMRSKLEGEPNVVEGDSAHR